MPIISHLKRPRRSFSKIKKIIDVPNLMDIQRSSYEKVPTSQPGFGREKEHRPSRRVQIRVSNQRISMKPRPLST
jgi:DNA-directed RNA polymerase beta subunit